MFAEKKHMVIVCAYFHPMKHIAAFRMNAFVKYLDRDKFNISVIASVDSSSYKESTFENAKVFYLSGSRIFKLRKQTTGMPRWKHILYSINNKLIRLFFKSDYPGWAKKIDSKLEELNAVKKIDILLTTFFPIDTHLAGLNFKKKNPSLIWVADMRDEMSHNALIDAKEKAYYAAIEKNIGQVVDVVTSVSQPIIDGFKIHMGQGRIHYLEVRNGFDHELKPSHNFNPEFTFTYAGTFYGKRKPDTFFNALLELHVEGKLPAHWKVQFLGTHHNFSIPTEFKDNSVFLEAVSNEKAVELLAISDCNLLIHPPSEAKGIFTGKLFDYLSVYKPILALVDKEDVAAQLIEDCKAGFNCDFYSIQEIKTAILEVIELWSNQQFLDYQSNKIHQLHRRDQVKKLENLLYDLM